MDTEKSKSIETEKNSISGKIGIKILISQNKINTPEIDLLIRHPMPRIKDEMSKFVIRDLINKNILES